MGYPRNYLPAIAATYDFLVESSFVYIAKFMSRYAGIMLLPIVILLRASRLLVWPFQHLLFSRRALILSKDKSRKQTSEFRMVILYDFIFSISTDNIVHQIYIRDKNVLLLVWKLFHKEIKFRAFLARSICI